METNLSNIVTHVKMAQCHSCDTHEYRLPFPITSAIYDFLICFGEFKYPIDKVKIIKIENEYLQIAGRIATTSIRVKFKKDPAQRNIFEIQLAAYCSKEMNITVNADSPL